MKDKILRCFQVDKIKEMIAGEASLFVSRRTRFHHISCLLIPFSTEEEH